MNYRGRGNPFQSLRSGQCAMNSGAIRRVVFGACDWEHCCP